MGNTQNAQTAQATSEDAAKYFSTEEAAELSEVPSRTLRDWVQRGLLAPHSEGEGKQRRCYWTEEDVAKAKALKSKADAPSLSELSMLAPLLKHLEAGKARAECTDVEQVVALTGNGIKVFQLRDTVAEMHRAAGIASPILLLPPAWPRGRRG